MKSLKVCTSLVFSLFVGLLVAFFPAGNSLAECIDYQDYMHWVRTVETPSTFHKMIVAGSKAFTVSEQTGLQIFDITQPDHPVALGSLDVPSQSKGIAVSGQYVYYGHHPLYSGITDFLIIDAADPASPTLVSTLELPGIPKGIAISGSHAFVAANNEGLLVIDISDPLEPEMVGQMDDGENYYTVTVRDILAFVLNSGGLQILDVSVPTNPQLLGNCDPNEYFQAMLVFENYVYVTTLNELMIFDITNLADPQVVSSLTFPYNDWTTMPGELVLEGQVLFVGTRNAGLQTVDVSNPSDPTIVGSFPLAEQVTGIALHENHAYLGYLSAWTPGFQVVDITNHLNPEMIGVTGGVYEPRDMVVSGDLACIASHYDGLKIVDISNAEAPQVIGGISTPEFVLSLDVSGSFAFVGEQDGGLQIIDLSDPTNPEIVGSTPATGDVGGVLVQGDQLFITTSDSGTQRMLIYDISSPTSPWYRGMVTFSTEYPYPVGMDVEGDIVCAIQDNWLFVVDISNPVNPYIVSTTNVPGGMGDVVMSGTRAFILGGNSELLVVDISDIANPVIENSVSLPSSAGDISIFGEQICIVDRVSGVLVLDISEPQTPHLVGSFPRPSGQGFSAATENHLFITGWDHELAVFPAQCSSVSSISMTPVEPRSPMLDANFPNPFNPQTSIGFRLPEAAVVSLGVYDLAGRLIRSIVKDEVTQEGFHTVVWDGRDAGGLPAASGVYFYRLDVGEFSETKRMVLIK